MKKLLLFILVCCSINSFSQEEFNLSFIKEYKEHRSLDTIPIIVDEFLYNKYDLKDTLIEDIFVKYYKNKDEYLLGEKIIKNKSNLITLSFIRTLYNNDGLLIYEFYSILVPTNNYLFKKKKSIIGAYQGRFIFSPSNSICR